MNLETNKTTRGFSPHLPPRFSSQGKIKSRGVFRVASGGFTMTELLISVSIFAIITTVFLIRSGNFGEQLLIENLAYDVALSIRRAQSYSIQVRQAEDEFLGQYGVHFDINDPEQYILFVDENTPGVYDDGGCASFFCPTDPIVETFSLTRGNQIDTICEVDNGDETCGHDETDITFVRPNPDAAINIDGATAAAVRVYLVSPREERWAVTVYNTGQIAVELPQPESDDGGGSDGGFDFGGGSGGDDGGSDAGCPFGGC